MVSHYEAKLKERVQTPDVETYREMNRESILGTYHRWTDQGRECEEIKQGCAFCSMAQYGFSRFEVGAKKCWQPEANEQLKQQEKSLARPIVIKHTKKWS